MTARETREGLDLGHLEQCDECGEVFDCGWCKMDRVTARLVCDFCREQMEENQTEE